MPEFRVRIEGIISQWSEDMQVAAMIRASEQGFPSIADHIYHMIRNDLTTPDRLNQFLKDHPDAPSEEEFVRKYMGDEGLPSNDLEA